MWFKKTTTHIFRQAEPEVKLPHHEEPYTLEAVIDCTIIALINAGIVTNSDQEKYLKHAIREEFEVLRKRDISARK